MMMKIKRSSPFEPTRRRSSLPIAPIVVIVVLLAVIFFLWSRGGEQTQRPVEKAIPAERLGK